MPKELTIEITNACMLNCEMCSSEAVWQPEYFTHMPVESIKSYLLRYADFEIVRLSGGDPLLHPSFEKIAELVKAENRQLIVLTSGSYTRDEALPESILQSCKPFIDELVFPILGNWDLHDCIATGIKNPDDIIHQSPMSNMLESMNRARSLRYNYSFHVCVLKKNLNDLENIVKIVDENCRADYQKTRMHFLKQVCQGRARNLEKISNEEWAQAINTAKELGQRYEIEVAYTGQYGCRCENEKAAITWAGKEVGCSALKAKYYGGKRPCQELRQSRLECS